MIIANGDFPPWLISTAFGLAGGAAVLFFIGTRRARPRADATSAPAAAPLPANAPAPPPPPVAVAPKPLAPHDPNTERRIGFRRVGNPVEVFVCDQEFKDPPMRGWVVDRSRHGVRLSLLDKFANGTTLQVRPSAAPDTVPWLPVEVRNAQPGEQCWELGCRFQQEPSWEVLLLFG